MSTRESRQIDMAREIVIEKLDEELEQRADLNRKRVRNFAYDRVGEDETIKRLAALSAQLSRTSDHVRRARDHDHDPVESKIISAEIDIDDALRQRCRELADEILDESERLAIEEAI